MLVRQSPAFRALYSEPEPTGGTLVSVPGWKGEVDGQWERKS